MGDASLAKIPSGKYRAVFRHGPRQYRYLIWKYNKLRNITRTKPKRKQTPNAFGKESMSFATITNGTITDMALQIYKNGTKTINRQILDQIDTLALAVWFMDDGYLSKNGGSLSSHSFNIIENKMIATWLSDRYRLREPRLGYDKRCDKWYVVIYTELSRKIADDIAPYLIEEMRYKVSWLGESND